MIKVYPSILPGEPIETHEVSGITVGEWLAANVPDYSPELPAQPITVAMGGVTLAPEAWADAHIIEGTCVEIRVLPRKGAVRSISRAVRSVGRAVRSVVSSVASALSSVISAVVGAVSSLFSWLTPSIPGQQSSSAGRQGSSIYDPNAQANAPKLGAPIPEIAGQHKVFPDYLGQPRKYFVNRTTQAVDMLLCIGKGHYSVPDAQIRIGSTPVQALGQSVDYQVFEPGESVTGHQASRRWYNAPEVGAALGAGAGLRLKSPEGVTVNLRANSVDVSGSSITANGGTVPSDWSVGTLLEVRIQRQIVANPPAEPEEPEDPQDPRAVFTGSFADLGLEPGDAIELTGTAIAGEYLVHSVSSSEMTLDYPDLTPVTSPTGGTYLAGMDRVGARYEILSFSGSTGMTVEKQLANGNPDTAWGGFPSQRSTNFTIRLALTAADGDWAGPFLACPQGEVTSRIEWDVFAPQGLGSIKDNGDIDGRSRQVELQWRPVGSSSWNSVTRTVSGETRDQLGWTFSVNLGGQVTPEVRVRRTSIEETTVQDLDRLEWLGLRSELPGRATSYPGVTTLALTLQGSDTIAGQSENRVSCVATRRLEPLGGGSLTATRSIAAWVRYVAHSIGYTDADLDIDELARLDGIWSSRGDTFDFVHDGDSTVKQVLSRCLRCGFADLTFDEGLLTPVRDEPRSTFEQMYTPQNMTGPLQRGVTLLRPDDFDGVDVEYFDATTWTNETVECRLPGDAGIRPEKIRLEGITNRTRAWRIGMRERRRLRYARWSYRFSTEMDALNSRLLSYVALGDDVPGYGQSALMDAAEPTGDGLRITLSEPWVSQWESGAVAWEDDDFWTGKQEVIAWRRPNGTLAGPFEASRGDNEYEVLCQPDEMPAIDRRRELPHVLMGTTDRWGFPALVRRIRPRGMDSVTVEAENYDPRIYEDDDNSPD